MDDISSRLKQVRLDCGLSQMDFSNKIGFTQANVSRNEKGLQSVSESYIKAVCREFNVDEIWLRTGEGEMFIQPDEDFAFLSAQIVSSDDDELKEITRMLWTLDVEELKSLKSIVKKIKENPNL